MANILSHAKLLPGVQGLVNCEDELYLGAALGCSVGIMRSRMFVEIPGMDYDMRKTRKALDEAVRAVRWHRIAPAFGAGGNAVRLSNRMLADTWFFRDGETWAQPLVGKLIRQSAPAVLARGIDLPQVECSGEPPFVAAARNPNGAVSIVALPRTDAGQGIRTPRADVTLPVGSRSVPVGIFGRFNSLRLVFDGPVAGRTILGQDLAADEAVDITGLVRVDGDSIRVPGEVIDSIGLRNATVGDVSDPGMVLRIV